MTHINLDIYAPPRIDAIFKRAEAETTELRHDRQREHDLRVKIAGEFESVVGRLRAELQAIADGRMECGCSPCRGSCRSKEAYEMELEAIRESAAQVLRECFP
jgi:hypothetical protein